MSDINTSEEESIADTDSEIDHTSTANPAYPYETGVDVEVVIDGREVPVSHAEVRNDGISIRTQDEKPRDLSLNTWVSVASPSWSAYLPSPTDIKQRIEIDPCEPVTFEYTFVGEVAFQFE